MSKGDTQPTSQTDWARVDATTDDQIDLSEAPELTDEWFRAARLVGPQGEIKVGGHHWIELAPDVADVFKEASDVNEALRLVKKLRSLGAERKTA